MPAKQVYGKRVATKTNSTYAKFISPDKDDAGLVGDRKTNAAAKADKEKSRKSEDELKQIEQGLEGLSLGGGEAGVVAKAVEKRIELPRKTGRVANEASTAANSVDVIGRLDALALEDDKENGAKEKTQRKRGRPRKAVEPERDILVTKVDIGVAIPKLEETAELTKESKRRSRPSTPVRGRRLKAVVIPAKCTQSGTSHLPTPEPTPEPGDPYTTYVSSLLSLSYGKKVISFREWSSSLEPHFNVAKIAEASFSEVYRLSAAGTKSDSTNESVLKLVALKTPPDALLRSSTQARGSRDPKRQAQKDLQAREEKDQFKSHVKDVHSEVKLLQNLNHIPGFTNFREVTVLQGRPSGTFIDAWKAWNKTRPKGKKSYFPDPSRKASYDDTQLWAVIEMQDAGTDCEKAMEAGAISTVWEVWDIFWGVCLSVAKAEEACRFEHRDLHLGNICIRSSRAQSEDDLTKPTIHDPLRRKLGFTGLDTTVIDYTLSRADILPAPANRGTSSSPSTKASVSSTLTPSTPSSAEAEAEVAYLDLNQDAALFEGDASEEYQYEIYRYMRGIVLTNDPLNSSPAPVPQADTPRRSPRKPNHHIIFDDNGLDPALNRPPPSSSSSSSSSSTMWKPFHPRTNLVWAHFILHKLLQHLSGAEPAALSNEQILQNVHARLQDADKVVARAGKLYKVLTKVGLLLDPVALGREGALGSVKELVVLAMEERWLRVGDVAGC